MTKEVPWKIPKIWEGGECWIIGGGPSMPRQFGIPESLVEEVLNKDKPPAEYGPYLTPIHDKHVLGINAAFMLGTWVDIVLFGDAGFYFKHKKALDVFPNVKVACSPELRRSRKVYQLKHSPRDGGKPLGITKRPYHLSWNMNTGAAGINLAYHLGAKRIFLLGFDMTLGPYDTQHWHSVHRPRGSRIHPKKLPFQKHLRGFPEIASDAKRLGVEIINVSPDSAIRDLPKVSLKEVL